MIVIIALYAGGGRPSGRLDAHLGTAQVTSGAPSSHAARLAARLAPLPIGALAAATGEWWGRHGAYAQRARRN